MPLPAPQLWQARRQVCEKNRKHVTHGARDVREPWLYFNQYYQRHVYAKTTLICMKISVIIPVYNEARHLQKLLDKVLSARPDEIVAVDDGSTDGSRQILEEKAATMQQLKALAHERNRGKGAAVRTALEQVTGEIVIIQDADLEYDPDEYPALLKPIIDGDAKVVYGSRNLARNPASYRRYYWGGKLLSVVTSILYGRKVTDQHTCYKVFDAKLLRSLPLRENGFGFCAEATAMLLNRKITIAEVPVSYHPRSFGEGKKIHWRDGLRSLWIIIRQRLLPR